MGEVIDDGFGNDWTKCARRDCDLHVVRPGKVQCSGESDAIGCPDNAAELESALYAEIKRLRAQINIAHNIIGSEAMIWLIVGANHPQAHLDAMREAVNTYWKAYGNVFRGPDEEDARG